MIQKHWWTDPTSDLFAVFLRLLLWLLSIILLPTQKVYSGPGTSLHWIDRFGASLCPLNSLSAIIFLVSLGFAALSLSWMSGQLLALSQLEMRVKRSTGAQMNNLDFWEFLLNQSTAQAGAIVLPKPWWFGRCHNWALPGAFSTDGTWSTKHQLGQGEKIESLYPYGLCSHHSLVLKKLWLCVHMIHPSFCTTCWKWSLTASVSALHLTPIQLYDCISKHDCMGTMLTALANALQLWLGFYLNNAFIPPCMLCTYCTESIVWSGVEYRKRVGKIYATRRLA